MSSLLLGIYEGEELVYARRAGMGLSARGMAVLENKFTDICQLYNYAYNYLTSGSRDKYNENHSVEVRGYDTDDYH